MITSAYFKERQSPWKYPEIMTVPLKCMAASASLNSQYALNRNICQMHCKYAIHGCKCCSEINTVSITEWMATTSFVKERNTVPWKKPLNIKND